MEVALGDRYRKFYRTLKNAKQNFQFNVQFKILSKIFIPNFIHSNSSQKYSYKDFMTQGKIKVMNCSKFGEKIKLPQNANKGCKYCQNIGPWWYSSCFNAKYSPNGSNGKLHWFLIDFLWKWSKMDQNYAIAKASRPLAKIFKGYPDMPYESWRSANFENVVFFML